jgi:hypothetical protein
LFEQTLSSRFHINRHRNGPFAAERERYLSFLIAEGRSRSTLKAVTGLLYCMAERLPLDGADITPMQIEAAAKQWSVTCGGCKSYRHNMERWFVFHATNWMRLLGRLQEQPSMQAFASELEAFMTFEEQERGFAPATVERVKRCLSEFLNWVADERKALRKITPEDIARYISRKSAERRWNGSRKCTAALPSASTTRWN